MARRKQELEEEKAQLLSQLDDINAQLDSIHETEKRRKAVKKNYKLNDVPDRIVYKWETICDNILTYLEANPDKTAQQVLDVAKQIKKVNSINYGKAPDLLYDCPQCGAKSSLYVGEYGEPFIKEEYAITCTNCDFVCPDTSSDYGEAWCEFHDWLVKHKYIPE